MSTQTANKRQQLHAKAVQRILALGNVALQGEGTKLWENNLDFIEGMYAFVKVSASGNYYLQPDVEGVTTEDGKPAKTFRVFAGGTYGDLETFEENSRVWIEVVQRTPKAKELVPQSEIDRINAWAEERAREEGRTMTGKATAAWEEALAKGYVSYLVRSIEEA